MKKTVTYSTLFTVSAALGFLFSAILSDNGSTLVKLGSDVIAVDKSKLGIEYTGKSVQVSSADETRILDKIITSAVERPSLEEKIRAETVVAKQVVAPKPQKTVEEAPAKAPVLKEVANNSSVLVKSGDTLYSIARKNHLTVQELASLNGLADPYLLRVGQKLVVTR